MSGDYKTTAGTRNLSSNVPSAPAIASKTLVGMSGLPSHRQQFNDAQLNALAAKGACYNCGKLGYISANCPKKGENAIVQEVEVEQETEACTDLGKEEP